MLRARPAEVIRLHHCPCVRRGRLVISRNSDVNNVLLRFGYLRACVAQHIVGSALSKHCDVVTRQKRLLHNERVTIAYVEVTRLQAITRNLLNSTKSVVGQFRAARANLDWTNHIR